MLKKIFKAVFLLGSISLSLPASTMDQKVVESRSGNTMGTVFKAFEGIEEALPVEIWHRIMDYLLTEYVDGLQAALTSSVVVPFDDALSSTGLICSDDGQKLMVPYTMAIAKYDPIEKQWRTFNASPDGRTHFTVVESLFLHVMFAQFLSKVQAVHESVARHAQEYWHGIKK